MAVEGKTQIASPEGLYKVGGKLFLESSDGVDFGDFLQVFNRWIQRQPIPGHMLIDVHDYRHVQHGPGILLVGHEGNFSLDFGEGRPGLLYTRKQAVDGELGTRLRRVLSILLAGCLELEKETIFEGRLKFSSQQLRVFANDRLNARNTQESFEGLKPELLHVLGGAARGPNSVTFRRQDERERLTVDVDLDGSENLKDLARCLETVVD